jgi:hypothetical protein
MSNAAKRFKAGVTEAIVTQVATQGTPSIVALVDPFETMPGGHAACELGLVGLWHAVPRKIVTVMISPL